MSEAAEDAQYELDVGDAVETEVEIPSQETDEVEENTASEEELNNYSESVQKRINRLTKRCVTLSVSVKKRLGMHKMCNLRRNKYVSVCNP